MESGISPLELLHPDGAARRATVIGEACPARLRPGRPEPSSEDLADLVVLAPSRRELGERDWLERAAETTAARLAEDGVAYVLAPPRARRRLEQLLADRGIESRLTFLHDPNTEDVRSIVPFSPGVAAYAFTALIATRPLRRRIVLRALQVRWISRLAARSLPAAAIAAGRSNRPLFAWLFAPDAGTPAHAPLAIVGVSWRGGSGAIVAHGFAEENESPAVVAKIRASGDGRLAGEAELLRRLGPGARQAGAEIPEVMRLDGDDLRAVLFQSALAGRTAAAVLGDFPALLPSIVGRLAGWLENWNLDTASHGPLSADVLEREISEPARALASSLAGGRRYVDWLDERCGALAGTTVPFVATHNDLTMLNVFIQPSGTIGVADWEDAREGHLPLLDFYYAAVDAAAAARRYSDRVAAFRRLFGTGASAASPIRELEGRLGRALSVSPPLAELAFHACWLRHATIEQGTTGEAGARPFLEILRLAAAAAQSARS
jgi:hypothetical protein